MLKIGTKKINVIAEDLSTILPPIITEPKEKTFSAIELPPIPNEITLSADSNRSGGERP